MAMVMKVMAINVVIMKTMAIITICNNNVVM
jgi:hypothetical protein